MRVLVCGGGGFIAGHLVRRLLDEGHWVRAVDIKPKEEWWQIHPESERLYSCDLRALKNCHRAVLGVEQVYNLAADMGGIGFIESHKADCMVSVLINTHLLMAAREAGVGRYFYSSSACAYHADRQNDPDSPALKEEDAYHNGGAMPEDGYGWEKLFSERMCRHFMEDYGLECRVARFHNSYGPQGSFKDGREKAPAALCRKVAEAKLSGRNTLEIWGDGTRTRSFMWIGDNVEGILRIMASDIREPINLGTSHQVTVGALACMIESIAGVNLRHVYDLTAPQGVMGRNSDNTKIKALLGWEPSTPLMEGLAKTYPWIEWRVQCESR